MTIDQIKNIISDNDAVLLWFGSNYEFAREVADKTAGHIPPTRNKDPHEHKEYVMLYLHGKYDGFNRDDSIEFFHIDFANKVAHYAPFGTTKVLDWLVVDMSGRKGRVV